MKKSSIKDEENQILENVLKTIDSLELPRLFELDLLKEKISTIFGREIEFIPCNMKDGTTGVVSSGETIHIFYEANISPIHQIQIKLHELGHVILGHLEDDHPSADEINLLESFYTSIKKYSAAQPITLKRKVYDVKSEQEAELFATELLSRIRLDSYKSDDPVFSISFQ